MKRFQTKRRKNKRAPQQQRTYSRKLSLEVLENRHLLAVDLQLLADINQLGSGSSDAQNFTVIGDRTYFTADQAFIGRNLWMTDGTPAGTSRVTTLSQDISTTARIATVNGVLYFATHLNVYRSDGTAAGTTIVPGPYGFGSDVNPQNLMSVGGTLYFTARSSEYFTGYELFKITGPTASAELVRDTHTGDSAFSWFTDVDGTLFFTSGPAGGGAIYGELWRTDPVEGAVQLAGQSAHLFPTFLTNVDGTLYFSSRGGGQIWKSDGTVAGTVQVSPDVDAAHLTAMDGTLYYQGNTPGGKGIWKINAAGNPEIVKDLGTGPSAGFNTPVVVGHTLYFINSTTANGIELWKTDGTAAGTVQVMDIRPGTASSNPTDLIAINGMLYFAADDGTHGKELWRTDGSVTGTELAADLFSGSGSSNPTAHAAAVGKVIVAANGDGVGREVWGPTGPRVFGDPQLVKDINNSELGDSSDVGSFYYLNGFTYFIARSRSYGLELWKTNGTEAGTLLVKDISPGANGSFLLDAKFTSIGNTLYFVANDSVHRPALWKSDGTEAGTVYITDIQSEDGFFKSDLFAANNTLYFAFDDSLHGTSLWKSDGTAVGTVLVKDVLAIFGNNNESVASVNGIVYFIGHDTDHGGELWRSDGTETGTVLVKDIRLGTSDSDVGNFQSHGGYLYFVANDGLSGSELWRSDGTEAGTILVEDIVPAGSSFGGIGELTSVGQALFFTADDGSGPELWRSDGTSAGTYRVRDIHPGNGSQIRNLTNLEGTVCFTANDDLTGVELWKSDGTEAGTVRVADIHAGSGGSYPEELVGLNGNLFFKATDGTTGGRELWRSDGTAIGTVLVKDVRAGGESGIPKELASSGGRLYFAGNDGTGEHLWTSDGTTNATRLLKKTFVQGSHISFITPYVNDEAYLHYGSYVAARDTVQDIAHIGGRIIFYASDDANGNGLWSTDGTPQGTVFIKGLPGTDLLFGVSSLEKAVVIKDKLYFFWNDDQGGIELWTSDGTASGTVMLKDIHPEPGFTLGAYSDLVVVNDVLYFNANDGEHGMELWKSDGTTAGTILVKDIVTEGSADPIELLNVNGILYFHVNSSSLPQSDLSGLWRTNGSASGTELVHAFHSHEQARTTHLEEVNGVVYYSDRGDLWRFDPASSSRVIVKSFDYPVRHLVEAGGRLYFITETYFDHPEPGVEWRIDTELWRTDGTEAGTVRITTPRIVDTTNGPNLVVFDGVLYLRLRDTFAGDGNIFNGGIYGEELWRVDPISDTAELVKDIYPGSTNGSGDSDPFNFSFHNGLMFFSADDGTHGDELWVTDGTESGTVLFADFGLGSSSPSEVVTMGDRLFVSAVTPDLGRELWIMDDERITKTLMEGNSPLAIDGTLRAIDQNHTDGIDVAVLSVRTAGSTGALSQSDILQMLLLEDGPIVAAPSRVGDLTWAFNSGNTTFDYLASGETLKLDYMLRYTDSAGDFVDQRLVITIIGTDEPPALVGDYNSNSAVDAADYVLWRRTLGSTTDLRANGDDTGANAGVIDQADYGVWRGNFGNAAPASGSSGEQEVKIADTLPLTTSAVSAPLWSLAVDVAVADNETIGLRLVPTTTISQLLVSKRPAARPTPRVDFAKPTEQALLAIMNGRSFTATEAGPSDTEVENVDGNTTIPAVTDGVFANSAFVHQLSPSWHCIRVE